MKVSIQWLKDYVAFSLPAEKLAHRLTMSGMEVEKIIDIDGDKVLELEITPNRPDCLSLLGIAREVGAVLNKQLKIPRARKRKMPAQKCDIAIMDRPGCARYIGQVIRDVQIAASPEWLSRRLSAVGTRAVNNVVDITNFCLWETGQPLHAFDYDKLIGGKIVVRRARAGEKIVTIDGVERELDPSILVIADSQRAVAIAGIMGGKDTEVSAATKNVLLESACFDPVLVRRAGRKLGLSSDSSYRFERGVDMGMVDHAARRATALIRELAQGQHTEFTDLYPNKDNKKKPGIAIRVEEVNRLLGASLTTGRCKLILKRLGFHARGKDRQLVVEPPSFRNDVKTDVDVMEELARISGYDNFAVSLPSIKMNAIPASPRIAARRGIRAVLRGQGFHEAISYTLISANDLAGMGVSIDPVRVQNPLSRDQELLRPTGIPGLVRAAQVNMNRGQKDLRLYELGKRYTSEGEEEILTLLMAGRRLMDWRTSDKNSVDIYDMKGVISRLFPSIIWNQVAVGSYAGAPYEAGEALEIKWRARPLGILGRLNQQVIQKWGLRSDDIYVAQVELESFFDITSPAKAFQPLCLYPAVSRDVSLAVKKDIPFQSVKELAKELGGKLLVSVDFLEEYLGDKIPPGHHGLVFSLVYQSPERTLTEAEVTDLHAKICQAFVYRFEAVIR